MTDVLTIPRFAGEVVLPRRQAVRRASRGLERSGRPPTGGDRPMHVRRRRCVCDSARPRTRARDRREVRRPQRHGPVRPRRRADARPHADECGDRRPGAAPGARSRAARCCATSIAPRSRMGWRRPRATSRNGRRWAHARRGHGLARPPARPRVGQRRDVHARDRERRRWCAPPPTSTRTCSGVSEAVAATSAS